MLICDESILDGYHFSPICTRAFVRGTTMREVNKVVCASRQPRGGSALQKADLRSLFSAEQRRGGVGVWISVDLLFAVPQLTLTLLAERELDTYNQILGRGGGGGLAERRPQRRRYDYSVADALTEEQRPKSRFAAIEQETAAWEGGGEGADGAEGAQAERPRAPPRRMQPRECGWSRARCWPRTTRSASRPRAGSTACCRRLK